MHHLFKPFARLPLLAATASVVVLAKGFEPRASPRSSMLKLIKQIAA